MRLASIGYYPSSGTNNLQNDWQLFCQNIDLLLNNKILNVADYFFCSPAFCYASFPYISGDGQLYLGHLLLGWKTGIFTEQCPDCKGKILITSFGGSPFSGSNAWTGFCLDCHQIINGKQSPSFRQWMDFVLKLRQTLPATVEQIEEYDAFEFSFGGNGLKPVIKKKVVQVPVANPVTLAVLVNELKAGNIRQGKPVNVCLLKQGLELRQFSRS